jgi:hypothetical protein
MTASCPFQNGYANLLSEIVRQRSRTTQGKQSVDLQQWINAVIAFRSFESRAKTLSMAQCLRLVHRDYTRCDPDPHISNRAYVVASVVELVLARHGDVADGVPDRVRQTWQELTFTEAPQELVLVAIRSIWRAQDDKRFGGWYGDKPSFGCKGIGIHNDEISPWQENAIRALEDGIPGA